MCNRPVAATLALAMMMVVGCGTQERIAAQGDVMGTQGAEMIYYEYYLYKMCEALGCYATIERLEDTITHTSPLSADSEVVDEAVTTIDDLVDKPNAELQGVTVIRSTSNPAVIHLIETALTQNPAYLMEQEVTLSYTGTLRGLVIELGQQLSGISPPTGGGIPPAAEDAVTPTTVSVPDEVVRNVLMGAVPLQGYSRFLFEAITYDLDRTKHTDVTYFGPPQGPPLDE